MERRWGPGPVFAMEWLTTSRRWQVYAGRMLFVGGLLLALACVWIAQVAGKPLASIHEQEATGQSFFRAIVTTQFVLILIVAPTALAGAICQDKARGNLIHLLLTDLSDAEIVLGKLAGRMVPVLGMVGCSLPVLALGSLLGGIDPAALFGVLTIGVSMAILCCSIALAFSTWGTRTYEVVLATMGVEAIWLLATPVWWTLAQLWRRPNPPRWAMATQPFDTAMGPYYRPGEVDWRDFAAFCVVALLISAGLIGVTIARIRAVVLAGGEGTKGRRATTGEHVRTARLDRDPAGWYERHRRKATPWMRSMIGTYFAFAIGFGGLAVWEGFSPTRWAVRGWLSGYVVAFSAAMGLPLIVLTAATSTVDERARGSLDVLLATPIPTRQVVLAKWWGAFRHVAMLLPIPTLVVVPLAWATGRWAFVALVPLSIVAWAASASSIGLAVSTCVARPARAVTMAVSLYMMVTLGWPIAVMSAKSAPDESFWAWTAVSPFYGGFFATCQAGSLAKNSLYPASVEWGCWAWAVVHALTAIVLLVVVLQTFDQALGRVPDRPGRLRPGGRGPTGR